LALSRRTITFNAATAKQAVEPNVVLNPEFVSLIAALPDRREANAAFGLRHRKF
jgi:hypothetical protein